MLYTVLWLGFSGATVRKIQWPGKPALLPASLASSGMCWIREAVTSGGVCSWEEPGELFVK